MAKRACVDYRDNTRSGIFYDEYRDDQGALQTTMVFKGRGIAIAENIKKVVVTDDVVVACCQKFALELLDKREESKGKETNSEVRTLWARVCPKEHRHSIKQLSEDAYLVPFDKELVRAVSYLCEACFNYRAESKRNLLILSVQLERNFNACARKKEKEKDYDHLLPQVLELLENNKKYNERKYTMVV